MSDQGESYYGWPQNEDDLTNIAPYPDSKLSPNPSNSASLGPFSSNADTDILTPSYALLSLPSGYAPSNPDLSAMSDGNSSDRNWPAQYMDPATFTPRTENSSTNGNNIHLGPMLNFNEDAYDGPLFPNGNEGSALDLAGIDVRMEQQESNQSTIDDNTMDLDIESPNRTPRMSRALILKNRYHPSPWSAECALTPGQIQSEHPTPNADDGMDFSRSYYPALSPPEQMQVSTATAFSRAISQPVPYLSTEIVLGPSAPPRGRGRNGKLNPEKRKKAKDIRNRRACAHCYYMKRPCSMKDPCEGCENSDNFRLYPVPCSYTKLIERVPFAIPKFLTDIHKEGKLDDHFRTFTILNNQMVLRLTFGFGPPLVLPAFKFHSPDTDLYLQYRIGVNPLTGASVPITEISRPIGVFSVSEEQIHQVLDETLNFGLLDYPAFCCQEQEDDLQKKMLTHICEYHLSSDPKSPLLTKALKLHLVSFYMAHQLMLIEGSEHILDDETDLHFEAYRNNCPRFANKQIKKVLSSIHVEMMQEVFEEFERTLRMRSPQTWPVAVCVMMIFCMVLENMQIVIDDFVACAISSEDYSMLPDDARHHVHQMDERLFKQVQAEFHMSYKSWNKRGFNPLRTPATTQGGCNVDNAAYELITNMCNELTHNVSYVFGKRHSSSEVYKAAENFADLNRSRLLTEFLKSFEGKPLPPH